MKIFKKILNPIFLKTLTPFNPLNTLLFLKSLKFSIFEFCFESFIFFTKGVRNFFK